MGLAESVSIADGRTLIGQVLPTHDAVFRIYVTSTDGGATWRPIPSPPGYLVIGTLASTPSGFFYAETASLGDGSTAIPGVYRLTPGASTWELRGALPNEGLSFAVSWDVRGNPVALWSVMQNPEDQVIAAGLTTHAP